MDVVLDMRQQGLGVRVAPDNLGIEHSETLEQVGAELLAQVAEFGPGFARRRLDHPDRLLPGVAGNARIGAPVRKARILQDLLGKVGAACVIEKAHQLRKNDAFHRNLRMLCCVVNAPLQRPCRIEDRRIG